MFKQFVKLKRKKKVVKNIWETDFEDIWVIEDKNHFLIALNGWICIKCNYGDNIEKLSKAESAFWLVSLLQGQVGNGGFVQFFFNSSGEFAHEIVEALCEIGAVRTLHIYKKVIEAVGGIVPKALAERENWYENTITDEVGTTLGEFDLLFYKDPDNLDELCYKYILDNKEQFSR